MKPIEQAFLADILESPDDDTPRLIYADWLEEDGQAERAEFIRVQCALGSLVEPEKGMCGCPYGSCEHCCYRRQFARHKNSLRRRGRKLLDIRQAPDESPESNKHIWAEGVYRVASGYVFRRGFVEEVTLSLADWLQHGPALVKTAPLRVVRLSDYSPTEVILDPGPFAWVWGRRPRGIGYPMAKLFDGAVLELHATEADALAAMSRCCLEYAHGKDTKTVPT